MIIHTPRVEFHCDVQGDIHSSIAPLVLLHGFTGNHHVWDTHRQKLKHPTIAIDLPGHGSSSFVEKIPEYSFQDWCDDFEFILESLNLKHIHFLGYSMGGRLALSYALRYPQKITSLILESMNPGIKSIKLRELRYQSDLTLSKKISDDFPGFIKLWESHPLFKGHSKNQKEWEKLRDIRKNANHEQLAIALRTLSVGRQSNLWQDLKKMTFPVLVMTGENDSNYSEIGLEIKNKLSKCQWISVENSGHTTHLEQPDVFSGHIENWLINHNTIV